MSRDTTLVSAQWVEEHLDDPKVVLVEVDEDTAAYDKGHIKGAIKLDWTTDLQDQVRRDFVSKAQFEALLSSRGVGNDDTVALGCGPTRLMLKIRRHGDDGRHSSGDGGGRGHGDGGDISAAADPADRGDIAEGVAAGMPVPERPRDVVWLHRPADGLV